MNTAFSPSQMGELEATVAVNNVLMLMMEVPVTGFVQVPLVTLVRFTVWVAVVFGMSSTKFPEASNVAVAGVPFKV